MHELERTTNVRNVHSTVKYIFGQQSARQYRPPISVQIITVLEPMIFLMRGEMPGISNFEQKIEYSQNILSSLTSGRWYSLMTPFRRLVDIRTTIAVVGIFIVHQNWFITMEYFGMTTASFNCIRFRHLYEFDVVLLNLQSQNLIRYKLMHYCLRVYVSTRLNNHF